VTPAWTPVGERPGSAGHLPLTTRTYVMPDGSHADWDIFGHERTVAILALTPGGDVVLARQFRPGPGLVVDELPGGIVEDGEDVLQAAAREFAEETGYGGELELAGTCWLASTCRTQRFVAVSRNAHVAAPGPQTGELCTPVVKSLAAFRRQLRSGQLTDVDLAYLALDHLGVLGPSV